MGGEVSWQMLKDISLRSLLPSLCELCYKRCPSVNILYVYDCLGKHIDRWHMWRAEQPLCFLAFHIVLMWVYVHRSSVSALNFWKFLLVHPI